MSPPQFLNLLYVFNRCPELEQAADNAARRMLCVVAHMSPARCSQFDRHATSVFFLFGVKRQGFLSM